jgi:hypothetical protein
VNPTAQCNYRDHFVTARRFNTSPVRIASTHVHVSCSRISRFRRTRRQPVIVVVIAEPPRSRAVAQPAK